MKRVSLTITKGSTWSQAFFWYDGEPVVVPILAITQTFPAVCTTPIPHGLPINLIPARFVGIKGPSSLNSDVDDATDKRLVLMQTATAFTVPDYNATPQPLYIGDGYLVYVAPKNLTGYKARMQFRKNATSDVILQAMTTETGEIVISELEGLTTVTLSAAVTAAFTFKAAVYDLELVLPGATTDLDVVTKTFYGPVVIGAEVTR